MTCKSLNCLYPLIAVIVFQQPVSVADTGEPAPYEHAPNSQQQGMQDNLEDAVPADGQLKEQKSGLKNPRIVIPENLQQMPQVKAVTPDHPFATAIKAGKAYLGDQRNPDKPLLLDKSDELMDLSRLPLTFIQEHVPFLTKRNIIFFGRFELDYSKYSSGVLHDDSGFLIRRIRLGLAGQVRFWTGWNYKLEFDLTDGENTLADAYLSWHSGKWGTIRIGNQKVAQTLSGQTSSISIPFMERPLPVLAFTLQRRLGVGWDVHRKNIGANITVFGMDPNQDIGSDGYAARFYYNPSRSNTHVLHIGGSWMQLSTDDDAQFDARPESHKTDIRLVDSGIFPDVGTGTTLGIELAGARGSVTFRSEFYRAEWSRSDSTNPRFKGWYAEASWFLTGEQAHYREGKFIRPNIISKKGAWELALRFSNLNLNDQDVEGGKQDNLGFAVNWYSQTHWRLMGNLIKVKSDGPFGEQNPWIVQFRAQYYF